LLYGDKEASDNAMAEIAEKFPAFNDYLTQHWTPVTDIPTIVLRGSNVLHIYIYGYLLR